MSAPPDAAEHQAAVEQVLLAVEWALLHPCPKDEWPAHWGETQLFEETVTPLAGEGAPLVAEFAPAALAAALDLSLDAGRQLVADALELTYRLPRLWALVSRVGCRCGGPGPSPGTPTTSAPRRWRSPTG